MAPATNVEYSTKRVSSPALISPAAIRPAPNQSTITMPPKSARTKHATNPARHPAVFIAAASRAFSAGALIAKVNDTERALEVMGRLANSSAAPTNLSTSSEDTARLGFEAGISAFMTNYTFAYASAQGEAPEIAESRIDPSTVVREAVQAVEGIAACNDVTIECNLADGSAPPDRVERKLDDFLDDRALVLGGDINGELLERLKLFPVLFVQNDLRLRDLELEALAAHLLDQHRELQLAPTSHLEGIRRLGGRNLDGHVAEHLPVEPRLELAAGQVLPVATGER